MWEYEYSIQSYCYSKSRQHLQQTIDSAVSIGELTHLKYRDARVIHQIHPNNEEHLMNICRMREIIEHYPNHWPSHKSKLLIHSWLPQWYSSLSEWHRWVLFARQYHSTRKKFQRTLNLRRRKAVRTTSKPRPLTFPPSVLPKTIIFILFWQIWLT